MIARKSAFIIATHLLSGIIGYAGLKFVALYMEPWEYGAVGFAYGFVALFSFFGEIGFASAHIKRVSEGKNLATCIGTFATIKTVLAGILALSVFIFIGIWKYVIGRGFETPIHEQAVYIMLAYYVLHTITAIFISTFNAKKEIVKSEIPLFSYNLVRITATIVVAYTKMGVLALAYTYVLGELFHFFLAFIFFRKYPVGKPSKNYVKTYMSFAFPMAIASVSSLVMTNIDKVTIQLFWGSQQVGEYWAVYNLSQFLILFSSAVGMLLFPTISEHFAKNNMAAIKDITLKSERYLSMIIFPMIILMVVLANPIIIILLSAKYTEALPVLQIVPFFILLAVMLYPYENQLAGMNMPHLVRNRIVLMMIINVVLNLLLVPKDIQSIGLYNLPGLGATGAAIGTVVSYFVALVYTRFTAFKIAKIKGNFKIIFHAIAAVIMGAIIYFLTEFTHFITITRWYHLVAISLFGLAVYYGILYLLREFKKEDFDLFIDTLNIKKMFKYIQEELGSR
ncbi:MAG: flippase [Candidatus Thermoplasmatota archaeon]|nr:flippase [Candidatus Thermoplasmatota archaeon]